MPVLVGTRRGLLTPPASFRAVFNPTNKADGTYSYWDTGQATSPGFVVSGGYFSWAPTEGGEQLSNGDFAAGATGWSVGGGGAATADYTGAECTLTVTAAGTIILAQNVATAVGNWVKSRYTLRDMAVAVGVYTGYQVGASYPRIGGNNSAQTVNGLYVATGPIVANGTTYWIGQVGPSFAIGNVFTVDDLSLKVLTLSTLAALVDAGTPQHTVSVKIHALPTGVSAGLTLLATADMTSNVTVWLDGTNLYVSKRVSGTHTILRTIATTFVADAELKASATVVSGGVNIAVSYNGVLLYTGTITDAAIIANTRGGVFDTDVSATFIDARVDASVPVSRMVASAAAAASPTIVLGPELNSGTLTAGDWYTITATQANYFYTGCAIGQFFRATAATVLDANNKVKALSGHRYNSAPCATQSGIFKCAPTVGSYHGGMAHTDVAGNSGWEAWTNGTNAYLAALGTGAAAISVAITYVAGATLEVVRDGTTFRLFYNGVVVGTAVTIAGLPTLTTLHDFGTNAAVSVASLQAEAAA